MQKLLQARRKEQYVSTSLTQDVNTFTPAKNYKIYAKSVLLSASSQT